MQRLGLPRPHKPLQNTVSGSSTSLSTNQSPSYDIVEDHLLEVLSTRGNSRFSMPSYSTQCDLESESRSDHDYERAGYRFESYC